MRARILAALGVATLFLSSCSSCTTSNAPAPRPTSVSPNAGYFKNSTAITIHGDGFVARVTAPAGGGTASSAVQQRAWMGGVELQNVTWVSDQVLTATVPAGLTPGSQTLVVENAYGVQGSLPNAFMVATAPGALLTVVATETSDAPVAATVSVGEPFQLSATITNTGATAATLTSVSPVSSPASTACEGGSTPAVGEVGTLGPNLSQTFTWNCIAVPAGTLDLTVMATAEDVFSGNPITASSNPPEALIVQTPPDLSVSLNASPTLVGFLTDITVTMQVTNTGDALAEAVFPSDPAPSGYASYLSAPQSAINIPGHSTGTFTFVFTSLGSFTGTTPETFQMSSGVSGYDGNYPASAPVLIPASRLGSGASNTVSVGRSSLSASFSGPATVDVNQSIPLTLSVTNVGSATAVNISPSVLVNGAVSPIITPSPTTIASLTPGESGTFTWTYPSTATGSAGNLAFSVSAIGTDTAFSPSPVQGNTSGNVLVQTPAALTATLTPSLPTVSTGQAFTATLAVTNTGGATANAVTPTAVPSCSTTPPAAPVPGGTTVLFVYGSCSSSTTGTLTLSATASGTDANVPTTKVSASASAKVSVQAAGVLTATLAPSQTAVDTGQIFTMTLTVKNSGSAVVTSVTPIAISSCTGTPAAAPTLNGNSSVNFTYTGCSSASTGTLSLTTSASGTDLNSGANLSTGTVASPLITVETAAALTATLTPSATTVSTGQSFTATLKVTNSGTAPADKVTPVAMSSCTITPAGLTVPGTSTVNFVYGGCSSSASGTLSLSASASGTDANDGAAIATGAATASVTVESAGTLTATLTPSKTTVDTGQSFTATLAVKNAGGAAVNAVTPVAMSSCTITPAALAVPAGSTANFTYGGCSSSTAGTLTLSTSASGTDANSGSPVSTGTVTAAAVTVQSPAVLTATLTPSALTVNTNQSFTATLAVKNGGTASANAVTPLAISSCTSTPAAAAVAGGATVSFVYAGCSSATATTLTLTTSASGTDANSGATVSTGTVTSAAITVQTGGTLTATLTPSATTVSTGQSFTATLAVKNSGAGAVNAVTPVAISSCTSTPAAAAVAGGATVNFVYGGCSSATATTLTLTTSASGTDATSGATVATGTVSSGTITVQAAASLSATLTPSALTVSTGQSFTATLAVKNSGTAGANGVTPVAISSCTSTPAAAAVAGGATVNFVYGGCSSSTAGSLTLSTSASGTDANSGATVSTGTVSSATITVQTNGTLTATLTPSATTVSTGQSFTATLAVKNGGTAAVNAVTPVAISSCTTTPAAATVAGGTTVNFVYGGCSSSTAGSLTLSTSASGTDANSGATVSTGTVSSATITVQTAAVLTATLTPSATTVNVGQSFTATLAVKNGGTAGASGVTPIAITSCTVTPAAGTVGGGATVSFVYGGCSFSTAGSFTLSASASGKDANSGATVSTGTVTSGTITVQTGGTLTATLTPSPTTVDTGQSFTATLAVKNAGTGTVNAVTPVAMSSCTSTPAAATIAGGATVNFVYGGCSSSSAGTLNLSASASGTDATSGTTVTTNTATASETVQSPAALTATLTPSATSVDTGQSFTATLAVKNSGTATANAVTPAAMSSCTTTPAAAAVAGGATVNFVYSNCSSTTATTLSLSASANGTDANTSGAVSATGTASVSVQTPAALSGTLTPSKTSVDTSQAFTVGFAVKNSGTATANAVTPSAITGCTTPAASAVGANATVTFTYTNCSSSSSGSFALSATASGSDANTGNAVSTGTVTGTAVTVQSPAAIQASVSISGGPVTVSVGEVLSMSLTITNTGGAGATITTVTPTTSGTGTATCGSVTGASQTVAGGATNATAITWSCTVSGAGNLTLGANVSGSDANTGNPLSASGTTGVTAQSEASLTAVSLAPSRSPVDTAQVYTVALSVKNGGTATANGVAPSAITGCTTPASQVINGGQTATFTYTNCSTGTASTVSLSATASGTDANSNATVTTPSAATSSLTVQNPPSITATISPVYDSATSTITATLTVKDASGLFASASIAPPAQLTATGDGSGAAASYLSGPTPAGPTTVTAGGAAATFTYTYSNSGTSAGTVTFSGSVQVTDSNTGTSSSFAATSGSVGVDSLPVQLASLLATTGGGGSVALVASDPLGDGTSAAGLTLYQGSILVGPSQDGTKFATLDPSGKSPSALFDLALGVESGATPASNTAWIGFSQAPTIGAGGCLSGTTGCGPDNESGADLVLHGTVGGVEQLFLSGAGRSGSRYLYSTSGNASPAAFAFTDVRSALLPGGVATAALAVPGPTADRLYLGYGVSGAGPQLLALLDLPASGGLDAVVGADVVDLDALAMPGVAGSTAVTSVTEVAGILYVAFDGGIVRAVPAVPGSASESPADWELATPSASAWSAKASVPFSGAGLPPSGRAVPALASFGSCGSGPCLYAVRNVQGTATQPAVVAQLWRCSPSLGPSECATGDWTLAAPNTAGDALVTQLGDETNGAATLLAATPLWLYLGFDNASTGVQLYRASVAPQSIGDLSGTNGCVAGSQGCQGLGGNGFGDSKVTHIFGAQVVNVNGKTSLWIAAGDGSGPERVYKLTE